MVHLSRVQRPWPGLLSMDGCICPWCSHSAYVVMFEVATQEGRDVGVMEEDGW